MNNRAGINAIMLKSATWFEELSGPKNGFFGKHIFPKATHAFFRLLGRVPLLGIQETKKMWPLLEESARGLGFAAFYGPYLAKLKCWNWALHPFSFFTWYSILMTCPKCIFLILRQYFGQCLSLCDKWKSCMANWDRSIIFFIATAHP